MPGPQLSQAVPVCRRFERALPHVKIVWGGYFPTQHAATVLASGFVDFVVRSQGEQPLLQLIAALQGERPLDDGRQPVVDSAPTARSSRTRRRR